MTSTANKIGETVLDISQNRNACNTLSTCSSSHVEINCSCTVHEILGSHGVLEIPEGIAAGTASRADM